MVTLTNKRGLPKSIVSAIELYSSKYHRGDADISMTQLIDAPKYSRKNTLTNWKRMYRKSSGKCSAMPFTSCLKIPTRIRTQSWRKDFLANAMDGLSLELSTS